MPTRRSIMRRIRDLLRMKSAQGLSDRAIAASLGLGKGSVGGYLRRARDARLSLIPSVLMPEIARVDAQGMALHGRYLTWSPQGAKARRRAATSGKGPAGLYLPLGVVLVPQQIPCRILN